MDRNTLDPSANKHDVLIGQIRIPNTLPEMVHQTHACFGTCMFTISSQAEHNPIASVYEYTHEQQGMKLVTDVSVILEGGARAHNEKWAPGQRKDRFSGLNELGI